MLRTEVRPGGQDHLEFFCRNDKEGLSLFPTFKNWEESYKQGASCLNRGGEGLKKLTRAICP